MLKSNKNYRWISSFLLCFAIGSLAIAAANPVMADHRRSCQFEVEVKPTDSALELVFYSFRIFNTVEYRAQANDGRRAIRRYVRDCVLAHWNDRNETRPYACQDSGRIEMSQYPFNNMFEQIRQDVCDKNRDELRLPVNIKMFVRGKRGCVERDEEGIVDPVGIIPIASDYQFNCPAREGGAFEPSPPLPRTRLPGHDLQGIGAQAPAETWQECKDRCERLNACRAWTWRAAETSGDLAEGAALCLLKSGADPRVSDPCCHSGIKEE